MPHVIITPGAAIGIDRCLRFLSNADRPAAQRAAQILERRFALQETDPALGRPVAGWPEWRELIIGFGETGYVARYRSLPGQDAVIVLAFRHQRQAGY